MANRWRNHGNRDFILGDSKITADGDWSHEIKRHLLLGRKTMTNLDSITKSCDITSQRFIKSKLWFFHIKTWELVHKDAWVLKDWCSQTVVLGNTLRIPWTTRWSIQSILKKINQNIHWRDWCLSWSTSTQWREFEQAQEMVKDREAWHGAVCGVTKIGHEWETTTEYSKLVKILSENIRLRKMFSLIITLEYMVRIFFAHCLHNYIPLLFSR